MRFLLIAAVGLSGVAFVVYLVASERRKLERAAQRYRELEHEGLEEVHEPDTSPEFGRRRGTMRLADGTEVDRDELLKVELERLRRFERDRARRRDAG